MSIKLIHIYIVTVRVSVRTMSYFAQVNPLLYYIQSGRARKAGQHMYKK